MTRTKRSGGRQVEKRLSALFDAAEAEGALLCPMEERDRRALQRRASVEEKPDVISPFRGLYARCAYWDALKPDARALHVMRGLARMHPDWVFSAQSAALAHGFPMSYGVLTKPHVVAPTGGGVRRRSAVVRHEVVRDEPAIASGVRVTSFWRTVFDCLATLDFDEALLVADCALRRKKMSRRRMAELLSARFEGCPGIKRAMSVCWWAEPCAESGGESLARATMVRLGFKTPHLQVELPDPIDPRKRFRLDFVWRGELRRLIFGEFDGKAKYQKKQVESGKSLEDVLDSEHERQTRLTVYRASFLRLSFAEARSAERLTQKLVTYGVPRDEPPRLVGGVPVASAEVRQRPTILGEGTLVLLSQRVRYTREAA